MTSEEYIRRRTPEWPVVALRLFVAYCLIFVGGMRLMVALEEKAYFREELSRLQKAEQVPWFDTYLDRVINPLSDNDLFVWLFVGGPLLLGVTLGLGVFTRLSALGAILMVLHSALIVYHVAEIEKLLFFQGQLVVLTVLLFSGAGRKFGLDGVFWRHRIRQKPATSQKEPAPAPVKPGEEAIPLSETKPPVRKRPLRVEETVGRFSQPGRRPRRTGEKKRTLPKMPAAATEGEPAKKTAETPKLEPIPLAGEGPGELKPVEETPKETKPENTPTKVEPVPLSEDDDIIVADMDEESEKGTDR